MTILTMLELLNKHYSFLDLSFVYHISIDNSLHISLGLPHSSLRLNKIFMGIRYKIN